MPTNILSIRTITNKLTTKECKDFWGYFDDVATPKEATTGIIGPRTIKFILDQIGLGHIFDREARDITFPKGAKYYLER